MRSWNRRNGPAVAPLQRLHNRRARPLMRVRSTRRDAGRPTRADPRPGRRPGFTLVEALIVVILVGLVMGIAANTFSGLSNDLENAAAETGAFFRQVRARAMTTTSAYRVVYASATELRTESARACNDTTWTGDAGLSLVLRERTTVKADGIADGDVVVCYNSRGIGNASPTLIVTSRVGEEAEVEIFAGGAVRVTRTR
jgi:prepilin-type N-terminal cleavage/methylation domain-containing protein